MKYLNKFNESKKPSHEVRNIAIRMIVSSIDARIGEGGAFDGLTEEDADRIKAEIDKICFNLENKIKN
jgi:hypothetical protein